MEEFLKNKLKIKDYKITYFDSGKNNITAKIDCDLGSFVIQKESKGFVLGEEKIIEKYVNYFINNKINFAGSFFENRFFDYEKDIYQVMKYIKGKTHNSDDITIDMIRNMSLFISNFHNISEKIEYKDVDKIKGGFKDLNNLVNLCKYHSDLKNKYKGIYKKISNIKENINIKLNLRKGILHGDPAFKNFIFDENGNAITIIDYEKMEYNNLIWDLVDMIRSLLQVKYYGKSEFYETINSYEKNRLLSYDEKNNLKNYLTAMILNTCTQYFLSLFESSGHNNNKGGKEDSLKKIDRCFKEIEKVKLFF